MPTATERSTNSRVKPQRKKGLGLLSTHGTVLFFIALNPGSTRHDIANGLHMTERSVWTLVRDLQEAGAVRPRRDGGRHYYYVNPNAALWEPLLKGHTVRSFVREVAASRP
jgi:arginine repressor